MSRVGVVFSNLGTPKSSEPEDVAVYLREFLMDPYVIDLPWPFRFSLVQGIIAPFRSKKSALNYKKIWTAKGSPLLFHTQATAQSLQEVLGSKYKVVVAMRYGSPSFEQAYEKLKDCQEIILFQQYPQFADSTVTTGEEHFKKVFKDKSFRVIKPYYNHPAFIRSYVNFLKAKLESLDYDHLLMSFHGLPESHVLKTDVGGQHCLRTQDCCDQPQELIQCCYRHPCFSSARGLARGSSLGHGQF